MKNKASFIFHYFTIILLLLYIILLLFLLLFFLLFYYYFISDYYFTIIFYIISYYFKQNKLFVAYINYFSLQVPSLWEPASTNTGPVHRDPPDYCIQQPSVHQTGMFDEHNATGASVSTLLCTLFVLFFSLFRLSAPDLEGYKTL